LAAQQVRIGNEQAFQWVGLFNTREHVKRYANRLLPDKQHTLSAKKLIAQPRYYATSQRKRHDLPTPAP